MIQKIFSCAVAITLIVTGVIISIPAAARADWLPGDPIASFTANPNPAAAGQNITFDGRGSSAGWPDRPIVDYSWKFGSVTANGVKTSNAYEAYGDHTVTLTVTDSAGKTNTATLVITVNQGDRIPLVDIGGPYKYYIGGQLNLDAGGTIEPDETYGDSIAKYEWDLNGDGIFDDAVGVNPRIQWADLVSKLQTPAQYPADPRTGLPNITIAVKATDSFGRYGIGTAALPIYDRRPMAVPVWGPQPAVPIDGAGKAVVHLDGTGSYHGHPDYQIMDWSWKVSGAATSLAGSNVDMQIDLNPLPDPFPAAGIKKTLILRVTDNIQQTNDASFEVIFKQLPSNPPLIKFNVGRDGIFIQQGEGFSLNASGTADPDGDWIQRVAWDINNDGTDDMIWNRTDTNGDGHIDAMDAGPGYSLQMTWAQMAAYDGLQSIGRHLIRLSVTDSTGTLATDTVPLNILEKALIAKAVVTPGAGTPGVWFAFSGTQSRHLFPGQSISSYQWDFDNDGLFEESGATVDHVFGAFNTYTVTLKATDSSGHSDTDTIQVSVRDGNLAPVADAGGPYVIDVGSPVTLDARASFDPNQGWGDSIVYYRWDFAGNELLTNEALITLPAAVLTSLGVGAGIHTISLKVEDKQGVRSNAVFTTLTIGNYSLTLKTTASPAGGAYGSAQSVTLSANEPATIYYTTDGSDPRTSLTRLLYGTSIPVNASMTIKYYAVDSTGKSGEVKTETYTIGYPLTVSKSGTGTGIVTSNPSGITCGSDCSENYNAGTLVTLTAAPDPGSAFTGWSGACTGTGTCQVPMDATKAVTVTFAIVNRAPVAGDSSIAVVKDMPAGAVLSASDADSNPLIYSIVVNGVKGTVTIANASTGVYTYTPHAGVTGADSFTFKVNDGLVDSNVATVMVAITALPDLVPPVSGRVPDTGQTKCYDNTTEIPCSGPGETFYGQDGHYTINPPSYTKLDATGAALPDSAATWAMVRDNVTGLIWENKTSDGSINDGSKHFTWCDTNPATNDGNQGTCGTGTGNTATDTEAFIKALNDANYGGFSDWRMPTPKELLSIADFGRSNPAIDATFFLGTRSSYYWSSTTYAGNTSQAWFVDFSYSSVSKGNKSYGYYVRAVRGGQSGSLDHLVDNGDGTVTDTATGLMWQQETSPSFLSWEAALTYGEGLSLAGYDDWRVPTAKELQSIVDYSQWNPVIDPTIFLGTMSSDYWSSTAHARYTNIAWRMSLSHGSILYDYKSYSFYVRAVRAGQSRLFGHLFISAPGQADKWNIGEQKTIVWDTAGIAGNVKISLSRQGGKAGTFETIAESTENNGIYPWTATGPISVNCVLKIEPLNDPSKSTSQGLFSIISSPVGTVVIDPEPAAMNTAAPWTLTGPSSFSQTGTGDQTFNNLTPGDYILTWGDVTGWLKPTPAQMTRTLSEGGTLTFQGGYYRVLIGTVVINAEPSGVNGTAPWTLAGPNNYSQSGTGDTTLIALDSGDYTLTWGDVAGWTKPSPAVSTQTLNADGTITFIGTYEIVTETVSVPVITGPDSGKSGQTHSYTAGGSISSLGHTIEYQFDWKGDGTDLSAWGSATQTKTWTQSGNYYVKARARCATHPEIVSVWSSGLAVGISASEAIRSMPDYYGPGYPILVRITVTPDTGANTYAVEDMPPVGWTVSEINESGSWDAVNNMVKWGPFFDHNVRTLTYKATHPNGETGKKTFAGVGSYDGVTIPIIGDTEVDKGTFHPADTTHDYRIAINECTSYGFAWKTGATWAVEPNPIPIGYMTNACYLWKIGEVYHYDANVPLPYVPGESTNAPTTNSVSSSVKNEDKSGDRRSSSSATFADSSAVKSLGQSKRFLMGSGKGINITEDDSDKTGWYGIKVEVTPVTGVQGYAVEETLPANTEVQGVNNSGNWDRTNGKVKWGPFLDNMPRTFQYKIRVTGMLSSTSVSLSGSSSASSTGSRSNAGRTSRSAMTLPPSLFSIKGVTSFDGTDVTTVNTGRLAQGSVEDMNTASLIPATWMDFDGDGRSDLTELREGTLRIALMSGEKELEDRQYTLPSSQKILGYGDWDGDGRADILFRDDSGNIRAWFMEGTKVREDRTIAALPADAKPLGIGDMNGDGIADLLWRDAPGAIHAEVSEISTASPDSLNAADKADRADGTDGVNKTDALSISRSSVTLGWMDTRTEVLSLGDYDGDGRTDILWRDGNGAFLISLMEGAKLKTIQVPMVAPSQMMPIGTGDMNGDGMADILWRDATGSLQVWLMNGANQPKLIQIAQPTPGWEVIGVGDYDGDGTADILWTYRPTGERCITTIDGLRGVTN